MISVHKVENTPEPILRTETWYNDETRKVRMLLGILLVPSMCFSIERPEWESLLNTGEYLYADLDPIRLRTLRVQFWFKLESVPEIPSGQRVLLLRGVMLSLAI